MHSLALVERLARPKFSAMLGSNSGSSGVLTGIAIGYSLISRISLTVLIAMNTASQTMQHVSNLLKLCCGSITLAVAVVVVVAPSSLAQVSSNDLLLDNSFSGDSSSDPFATTGSGQMRGAFDLFHRANLGGGMTPNEFGQHQQESISTEAQSFRERQLFLLQQREQSSSTEPAIEPEGN